METKASNLVGKARSRAHLSRGRESLSRLASQPACRLSESYCSVKSVSSASLDSNANIATSWPGPVQVASQTGHFRVACEVWGRERSRKGASSLSRASIFVASIHIIVCRSTGEGSKESVGGFAATERKFALSPPASIRLACVPNPFEGLESAR